MHEVSKAINILDITSTIDGKICGAASGADWHHGGTHGEESPGKCGSTINSSGSGDKSSYGKLSHMFTPPANKETNHTYKDTKTNKMGEHTSAKISKDIIALNREEHGVVSSAFAKALEGAEIVEIR
ncbi:hypothetical protein [Anaplasma bovis]|uniref:hypothetical protein n=1 Tax=Anaplasma bovis TaxID=186733 RepID=UPI002FF1F474